MKKVLLVHGIFMNSFAFFLFAKRLRNAGYEVVVFDYLPFPSLETITNIFVETVKKHKPHVIIGHSLGGVIAVNVLSELSDVEKVICIGSPLKGSLLVRTLLASSFSFVLPKSVHKLLSHGVTYEKVTKTQVGVIAGKDDSFGFLALMPVLRFMRIINSSVEYNARTQTSDGTVLLEETQLHKDIPHTTVLVGHTALIFSEHVFTQSISFIERGVFVSLTHKKTP